MKSLQLDNPDEQAAQVRRELASRQQQLDTGAFRMVSIESNQDIYTKYTINIMCRAA